jgi:hypothetical protein
LDICTVGVGNFWTNSAGVITSRRNLSPRTLIAAVGVGNDPDAVPPVRRTNGRSWDNVPLRVIPERGQRPEYFTHPSSKQRCDVLHDNVSGSKLANDPSELVPKTGPCAGEPGPFPGVADVLAREAAADEIDFPVTFFRGERADIGVSPDIGPVFGEHFLGIRVDLHLPSTLHPGPF